MTERIAIETEAARVEVIPKLGGSLAAFDLKGPEARQPVFRRWSGESESPRTFACIPMVPWFARISGGGIRVGGVFYPIQRNDPEDTHPLHGDGWQSPWEVVEQSADRVALRLRSRAIPPFDYTADLTYALSGAMLDVGIAITHHGPEPVPYGMGVHPWFPRTPDVTLQAAATGTWLEQPPELPKKAEPDPLPPAWDFSEPKRLPAEFIDNSVAGWDRRARIEWPEAGYAVSVSADPSIRLAHLYAPGPDKPIFCFEAISHMIDAFNIPAPPEQTGLRILGPGEQTRMTARFAAAWL